MKHAEGQKKAGWNMYHLPSPRNGMTSSLIMSHGSLTGQYRTTPINLHFFAPHGQVLKNPSIVDLVTKLRHNNNPAQHHITSGQTYPDMYLSKVLGRGGEDHDYELIHNSYLDAPYNNWVQPHVFVVRHRVVSNQLKLSQAISQIQNVLPNVTDIYVAACRPFVKNNLICEFTIVPGGGGGRRPAVVGWTRPAS